MLRDVEKLLPYFSGNSKLANMHDFVFQFRRLIDHAKITNEEESIGLVTGPLQGWALAWFRQAGGTFATTDALCRVLTM